MTIFKLDSAQFYVSSPGRLYEFLSETFFSEVVSVTKKSFQINTHVYSQSSYISIAFYDCHIAT